MHDHHPLRTIALLPGDGSGPEVVGAAQRVIQATGAPLLWEECEVGKRVFERGIASGVLTETITSIHNTHVVLKGPFETPVVFWEKSANVTLLPGCSARTHERN